ncbi:gamma-glutamylcyclotransferase [Photobacterium sp. DA100]|uniref:gamma-glutamylcyclotransferase family protein n=1 Tax=Photobacterium sp. DA100 TaxID=3027472 RepID=UPI002478D25A|nr:gamma-glutamylcyclotransferase family protein [Photobacterium sp. DA100]WEM42041.1 gamma-glutamylcyclotransferase [Photobacterium sp. DA100]
MKVFVYGTLRAGEANAYLLKDAVRLGDECLASGYILHDLGAYPAAIASLGGTQLLGEVYQINDEILHSLDWLEEYPVEYDRVEIMTSYGVAWIYLYNHSVAGSPVIGNGDWCQRKRLAKAS